MDQWRASPKTSSSSPGEESLVSDAAEQMKTGEQFESTIEYNKTPRTDFKRLVKSKRIILNSSLYEVTPRISPKFTKQNIETSKSRPALGHGFGDVANSPKIQTRRPTGSRETGLASEPRGSSPRGQSSITRATWSARSWPLHARSDAAMSLPHLAEGNWTWDSCSILTSSVR